MEEVVEVEIDIEEVKNEVEVVIYSDREYHNSFLCYLGGEANGW